MKSMGKVIGAVVVLAVAGVAAFALLFDADQFRPRVEASLTQALHRQTHIGKLSLSVLHGRVEADSLSIADDPAFGGTPFIQAKSVGLQVGVWELISQRKLDVSGIVISEPVITLVQDPKGVWNYATLGSPASAGGGTTPADAPQGPANDLSIAELHVSNGRLTVGKSVLENAEISATNISRTSAFPFTVAGKLASGGEFRLEGKAGPIPSKDASKIPVQLTVKVQKLSLDPYGMGGLLSLDGQASSDGQNLDWTGSARLDAAKFTAKGSPSKVPLALEIALRHNLESHQGAITRGAIHIGKADATLSGGYAMNGPMDTINLHILAKAMPVPDLIGLLPALDIQLPAGSSLQGGTLSADLTATGDAEQPVITGVVDVANTKLGGFNVGEKLAVLERLAGIQRVPDTEIQKLHTRLRTGPAGTVLDDMDLVLPAVGKVTGAGTVSPAHELNFKMRASVKTRGTALAALGEGRDTSVPFSILGTSASPVFRADTTALVTDQLDRLRGKNVGGVDAGKAADAIRGIFGRGKKQ